MVQIIRQLFLYTLILSTSVHAHNHSDRDYLIISRDLTSVILKVAMDQDFSVELSRLDSYDVAELSSMLEALSSYHDKYTLKNRQIFPNINYAWQKIFDRILIINKAEFNYVDFDAEKQQILNELGKIRSYIDMMGTINRKS